MALVCGCRSLLGPYKCAQAQWLRSQSTYGDFVAWVVWKFLILSIITQREQQATTIVMIHLRVVLKDLGLSGSVRPVKATSKHFSSFVGAFSRSTEVCCVSLGASAVFVVFSDVSVGEP